MSNIDMDKIQRINFTLNPRNAFDYEVLEAIEKLKDEGYNVSARIKKLLINDANNIITVNASNDSVVKKSEVKKEIVADNDDEDDNDNVMSGGFDVPIDFSDMPGMGGE